MQNFGPYGFQDPSQQFRGPYVNDPRIQIVPQGQTLIYGQAPAYSSAEKHLTTQQKPENYQNQPSTNVSSKFPTASKSKIQLNKKEEMSFNLFYIEGGQDYENGAGDQRRSAWGKNRDPSFLNSDLKRSEQDDRYRQDEIPRTLEPTMLETPDVVNARQSIILISIK